MSAGLGLVWLPPTPDELLAEWRTGRHVPSGWVLEVASWGDTWRWEAWPPWSAFRPVESGTAPDREAAMEAAEAWLSMALGEPRPPTCVHEDGTEHPAVLGDDGLWVCPWDRV